MPITKQYKKIVNFLVLCSTFILINFNSIAEEYTYRPLADTPAGSSDASAAVSLGEYILVADDEANRLRLYLKNGGVAVKEWNINDLGASLKKELDIEGVVLINDRLFITGSHSNKSSGKSAQKHTGHVLAFTINNAFKDLSFSDIHQYSNLDELLTLWDSENLHQLGENRLNLLNAIRSGQIPESINGFSIEGLSKTRDNKSLLFGFRAPLIEQYGKLLALIVPVKLPESKNGFEQKSLDKPWLLDLGNRGIRDLYLSESGQYFILAGPAGGTDWSKLDNFALFKWTGNLDDPPSKLDLNLDEKLIKTKGSFESIGEVQIDGNQIEFLLLMDNGDSLFDESKTPSKKRPFNEQKFLGVTFLYHDL